MHTTSSTRATGNQGSRDGFGIDADKSEPSSREKCENREGQGDEHAAARGEHAGIWTR